MPPVFWTQRLHFGPGPRLDHAMAYDDARQRVVLFGGRDGRGSMGDTWVWDGTFWTQVADTGPLGRGGHAMAYDSARRQVVLFGGGPGLVDTWVWDGVAWTQVAETGPSARRDHAMVGDDARGRVVLFGGLDGAREEQGDTWEWDGLAWTQREERGPAARRSHSMAYDAAHERVVLFGGASQDQVFDDTWEWNAVVWRQVAEFGAPGALDAAMAYDGQRIVLFGGAGSTTPEHFGRDETWEWDGHFWTEIQHFGVPARVAHAMVLDAARQRVTLFGGARQFDSPDASMLLGDTWEFPGREPLPRTLRIVAALPNPVGDETLAEEIHIRNDGASPVSLIGWRVGDADGQHWLLDAADGTVAPGAVVILLRQGRTGPLPNTGGTIQIINPAGEIVDTRLYGPATSGQLIRFA